MVDNLIAKVFHEVEGAHRIKKLMLLRERENKLYKEVDAYVLFLANCEKTKLESLFGED